jgi:hypothetical membrane protein
VAVGASATTLEGGAHGAASVFARVLLIAGVIAPLGYFALQIAAAQLYPGYNFRDQVASELGIAGNASASLFNAGAFSLGVLYALGAIGVFFALHREKAHVILAALVALCLLSHGLAAFNASIFPLPSPRHNPGPMQAGMFVLPLLAPLTWLFIKRAPIAKGVLWFGLVCFVALAATMSGATPIDPRVDAGAWQRVAAITVNLPVFVVCVSLLARYGKSSGETASA